MRLALFGAIPLGLCFVGCTSAREQPSLAIYSGDWNADDARLEGKLVQDGSCLLIDDSDGVRWLVAFAADRTSWDQADQEVHFGGRSLRLGERVAVGGSSPPGYQPEWIKPPAPTCQSFPVWFVAD